MCAPSNESRQKRGEDNNSHRLCTPSTYPSRRVPDSHTQQPQRRPITKDQRTAKPKLPNNKNSHDVVVVPEVLLEHQELAPSRRAAGVDVGGGGHQHVIPVERRVGLLVGY